MIYYVIFNILVLQESKISKKKKNPKETFCNILTLMKKIMGNRESLPGCVNTSF